MSKKSEAVIIFMIRHPLSGEAGPWCYLMGFDVNDRPQFGPLGTAQFWTKHLDAKGALALSMVEHRYSHIVAFQAVE